MVKRNEQILFPLCIMPRSTVVEFTEQGRDLTLLNAYPTYPARIK